MSIKQIKKKVVKLQDIKKPKKQKIAVKKQKDKENIEESILPIIPFKDLEGKFLHVKVGNDVDKTWQETEFSNAEVEKVEQKFIELIEKNKINCLVFVTHHAVEINLIESNNRGPLGSKGNEK